MAAEWAPRQARRVLGAKQALGPVDRRPVTADKEENPSEGTEPEARLREERPPAEIREGVLGTAVTPMRAKPVTAAVPEPEPAAKLAALARQAPVADRPITFRCRCPIPPRAACRIPIATPLSATIRFATT